MRILSSELIQQAGKSVQLAGWLHKKRKLGGLTFLLLRDRGGLTQIKIEQAEEADKLRGLQIGTVLEVNGIVAKDKRAPGGIEIHDPKLNVLVPVIDTPPIEIDKPIDHTPDNLDTLFEHRGLNLRNLDEAAVFKINAALIQATAEFFRSRDFIQVFTPKLLSGATEGGAEVFKLDYYGQPATLAQSPQFYKQMLVGVFERVFEIAPVYRAEPSLTTRHMSEYISIDMEMGFVNDLDEVTTTLAEALRFVVDRLWQERSAELKQLKATRPKLPAKFPVIGFNEVHQLYSKATKQKTIGELDLRPAEERWLSQYALKKWHSEAIFVTDYPASAMKFYHRKSEDNPEVALRFDLLFRGVEIMTGSLREHRYDKLVAQLKGIGGDPNHPGFKYFLQAFKYGLPPHGGAGWGLERTLEKLIGLKSVKEASLFPRDMHRLSP